MLDNSLEMLFNRVRECIFICFPRDDGVTLSHTVGYDRAEFGGMSQSIVLAFVIRCSFAHVCRSVKSMESSNLKTTLAVTKR